MKLVLTTLVVVSCAAISQANTFVDYDWEDDGTVLAVYPDPDLPSLVATNVIEEDGNHVYAGAHSLRLEYNESGETAVAYLAYLWNLVDGDNITASFYRYDDTPGAYPHVRIAAHWNDQLPGDPDGFDGLAGGNEDYGPGLGWDQTQWSWTAAAGHTGLVIEARVNGEIGDVVWLDALQIEVPGEESHVYVRIPGDSPVGVEQCSWSQIKSLYR